MPILEAISKDKKGSYAKIFIPKPLAIRATVEPIRPNPTMPNDLSNNSTPLNLLRSHLPLLRDAQACGILRDKARIRLIVCSAVDVVFPPGVFIATTPRL